MLEAITLGNRAIVPVWSGNIDSTIEPDACIVGFDLVPVQACRQANGPATPGRRREGAKPWCRTASALDQANERACHLFRLFAVQLCR